MITHELTLYIREALRRGMNFDTIKTELLRVGWSQEDIVRCYDSVYNETQTGTNSQNITEKTVSPVKTYSIENFSTQSTVQQEIAPLVSNNDAIEKMEDTVSPRSSIVSFIKVFFLVSVIILCALGFLFYKGFFINNTLIHKSLLNTIQSSSVTTTNISFSLLGNSQGSSVLSGTLFGSYQRSPVQSTYALTLLSQDGTQFADMEIRNVDGEFYVYPKNLPENLSEELVVYENQWFVIPSTQNTQRELLLGEIPVSELFLKSITTFLGGNKTIKESPEFFVIKEKQGIHFIEGALYHKVVVTINPSVLASLIAEMGFSTNDTEYQFIQGVITHFPELTIWVNAFDTTIETIDLGTMTNNPNSLSGTITFSFNEEENLSVTVPALSYDVNEFIEKARTGEIQNILINGISYSDYVNKKMLEEEQEQKQIQIITFLTQLVNEDFSSTYFLANKRSFKGVCNTTTLDIVCREGKNGFIFYSEIQNSNTDLTNYACVDAYTKETYSILEVEPKNLRCQ